MLPLINTIFDNFNLTNTQIADQNLIWHVFSAIIFNITEPNMKQVSSLTRLK